MLPLYSVIPRRSAERDSLPLDLERRLRALVQPETPARLLWKTPSRLLPRSIETSIARRRSSSPPGRPGRASGAEKAERTGGLGQARARRRARAPARRPDRPVSVAEEDDVQAASSA